MGTDRQVSLEEEIFQAILDKLGLKRSKYQPLSAALYPHCSLWLFPKKSLVVIKQYSFLNNIFVADLRDPKSLDELFEFVKKLREKHDRI